MSKVRSVFITGANRGIGLQLVKSINARLKPRVLFATYRDVSKAEELLGLSGEHKNIHLLELDVTNHDKFDDIVASVRQQVGDEGLNLLINNAGVTSKFAKISAVRPQELRDNFEINAVAPIMLTKAMIPLLEAAATNSQAPPGIGKAAVINFSSILGSISDNDQGGMYAYRCSKAAINAATKSMSFDFKKSGIISVALHPGWVRTDMGGQKAPLSPEESVNGIVSLLESLDASHSGKFMQYDGKELPW